MDDLLNLYQGVYEQLTDLKHIIFSSTQLSELEPLAVLLSNHIRDRVKLSKNAVWLSLEPGRVHETVRNGKLVAPDKRRRLDIEASDLLKRVLQDQIVVWPDRFREVKELFPEFEAPMLIPIKGKSMAFGFFSIDQLPEDKRELVQFLGQFTGLILNISCLHQEVVEQRKELGEITDILFAQNAQMASLHHMSLEISKCMDPVHLCCLMTETVVGEFGALTAAAFMMEKDSDQLAGAWESGGLRDIENLRLNPEETDAIRLAVESGRVVSHKDCAPELMLGVNRLKNWIIVPLKAGKITRGILVAETGEMDITDPISIMANYAGLVLDKLMALETLSVSNGEFERFSTIDHLTGLHNHRYFQERFKAEFSRAHRHRAPLTFMMIDLDHFKAVNDRFGHAVGDQVLKAVSNLLRDNLRVSDITARYGGEEFAVLLPETPPEVALIAAEKLRRRVWDHAIPADGKHIKISISIGVAGYPGAGIQSREDLFNKADEAMYRAKKAGRNQVM